MIVFRYLFKEILLSFVAVSTLLLTIFMSSQFIGHLSSSATGRFSSVIIFKLMAYSLPGFAEIILPASFFIAIILAVGRMYVDSEMIVLKACRYSQTKLLSFVMVVALCVAVLVGSLSLWLTPKGNYNFLQLKESPESFQSASALIEGGFKRFMSRQSALYIGELSQDKQTMLDVFIALPQSDNQVLLLRSNEATMRTEITKNDEVRQNIRLKQGALSVVNLDDKQFSLGQFKAFEQNILQQVERKLVEVDEYAAYSTEYLVRNSYLSKDEPDAQATAEIAWRLSLLVLIPISAIIALALSETTHRKGRYSKLLPAVILYLLYFTLLVTVKSQITKDASLWVNALLLHAIFLAIGLYIYYSASLNAAFRVWRKAKLVHKAAY